MFDHVGLKVSDLARSVRFYKATLGGLGHEVGSQGDGYAGLGPKGAPALWLYANDGAVGPGTHVAFVAPDRAAVARFHAQGLAAGGRDNGGRACAANTATATTRRSCWTPMATMWKRFALHEVQPSSGCVWQP